MVPFTPSGTLACFPATARFLRARPAALPRGMPKGGNPEVTALLKLIKQCLPAGLLYAGQFAGVGHVAETHTRDTELLEGTAGAAVNLVAVAKANR